MDPFVISCAQAANYPKYSSSRNVYWHHLDAYYDKLNERESCMFIEEHEKAASEFWERETQTQFMYERFRASNVQDFIEHVHIHPLPAAEDPAVRFIFLNAPHGRAKLRVTRKMSTLSLTYHQVMPSFLDFLFPFGQQEYAEDFYSTGFRAETHLSEIEPGLQLPTLGRSGRMIQMCYNLKSVERSNTHDERPWSVRQAAVYHSFDFGTGKASWIVAKGNTLSQERIKTETSNQTPQGQAREQSEQLYFASTLDLHCLIFDWSAQNWRWYFNSLEESMQKISRRALAVVIDEHPIDMRTIVPCSFGKAVSRQSTWSTSKEKQVFPLAKSRTLDLWRKMPMVSYKDETPVPTAHLDPEAPQLLTPPMPPDPAEDITGEYDDGFRFDDSQRVQGLEEATNEASLLIGANIDVLQGIREQYQDVMTNDFGSPSLGKANKEAVVRFDRRMATSEKESLSQQVRINMLMRLMKERKTSILSILEFRNIQITKRSSIKMELMTKEMHEIAVKTKRETVSMKIITLVTLFFLPGTFISTLMSTDIIQYDTDTTGNSQESFSDSASRSFMALTVPLMVITFLAWAIFYWWVTRKEAQQKAELEHRESIGQV